MKPTTEKKSDVSSTGRVTRVDVKYAFISNEKLGSVFVPPCAVLPPACPIPDLTKHLKAGDVVHFVAVRQHGKNECQWLATKVVMVSLVTETFAYGLNEELGMVFIPGAAFSSYEVSKLNSYITCGDSLIVSVRPQAERSGCCWLAEFATKACGQLPMTAGRNNGLRDLGYLATSSDAEGRTLKKGYGTVVEVNKTVAFVHDALGETILCSSLAWNGGCRGNLSAEGLDEIISPGEKVCFDAACSNGGWRAKSWDVAEKNRNVSEAFTQTAITSEQMIIRALDDDIIKYLQTKIPHILAFNQL